MENKLIADFVLQGATIFCGKGFKKDYDFIAIKENKLIKIGQMGQEQDYIGKETRVIQFDKKQLIIPGLHDNHIHLIQAGMLDKYVNLTEASSQEEAAKMVSNFAKTIPEEEWIMGFGWSRMSWENKKLPSKDSLDQFISDRPVFLLDSELHGAWVNTKAFERCGITANTEDPPFGTIERDENGEATGYLYETALCLVGKYAFNFSDELVEELIMRYMKKAVRWGITSVSDMTPYLGLNLAYENTYFDMDKKGLLDIRINAARNLFEDMDSVLSIQQQAAKSGTGMYRVPYMKQFLDGVITNYTALMLEPYCNRPNEKGGALLDLQILDKAVEEAHKNSISVRLHACGDGAVRVALDSYEKALKKYGDTKARHQIEHIESIHPSDLPRLEELGVIASVQPEHIVSGVPTYEDNCYPQLLGPDRVRYTWAFKSLIDEGAVLAYGSDAPVVEGDPFYGMYCGLERIHPDGSPKGGWNPEEKITIEDLIHGYTYGAAYAEGREGELGTLEEGKLADITVIDRNLFISSSQEIKDAKAILTIVDGRIVYEENELLG